MASRRSLILILCIQASYCRAQQSVTIPISQTNTISSTSSGTTSTALIIRNAESCATNGQAQARIYFNVLAAIPSGATIQTAKLFLTTIQPSDVDLYRAASNWESSPTWNSVATSANGAPTNGPARTITPSVANQIIDVDVANDLAIWLSGLEVNNGFVLKAPNLNCQDASFRPSAPNAPRLEVTYTFLPKVVRIYLGQAAPKKHSDYFVPSGSGEQLRTVPVGRPTFIAVVFNQPVDGAYFTPSFALTDVATGNPISFTVGYSSTTNTAFIDLNDSDNPRKLQLTVLSGSSAIRSPAGVLLDGEWTNPSTLTQGTAGLSRFPADSIPGNIGTGSGDGVAGGNFVFRLVLAPGDYNRNNVIDSADYTVWRDNNGLATGALFTNGDGNGNGAVNTSDHTIWVNNFGRDWTSW